MKTDFYTKVVLTVIAASLFAIALKGTIGPARAQDDDTSAILSELTDTANDVHLIALGSCSGAVCESH